jgi:hypothetical protein
LPLLKNYQSDLTQALKAIDRANSEKNLALAKYSESANAYAKSNFKLTQVEFDYQSAQAQTNALYNKITKQTEQVTALQKLSEFSKASIKNIKEVLNY